MKPQLQFLKEVDRNLQRQTQAQLYNNKTSRNDEILFNKGLFISANNFADPNSDEFDGFVELISARHPSEERRKEAERYLWLKKKLKAIDGFQQFKGKVEGEMSVEEEKLSLINEVLQNRKVELEQTEKQNIRLTEKIKIIEKTVEEFSQINPHFEETQRKLCEKSRAELQFKYHKKRYQELTNEQSKQFNKVHNKINEIILRINENKEMLARKKEQLKVLQVNLRNFRNLNLKRMKEIRSKEELIANEESKKEKRELEKLRLSEIVGHARTVESVGENSKKRRVFYDIKEEQPNKYIFWFLIFWMIVLVYGTYRYFS